MQDTCPHHHHNLTTWNFCGDSLGYTTHIPSQIIWIPFGCRCATPTSHSINFCCVGQAEACLTESTLDTSAHGGQNAGPIHWIGLPLDVAILVPYQHFKHKLLVVQTTLLIESLNLYIPQLADDETYQLLRLRRHIVKLWIRHMTPHGSWTSQFLRRYWSFIGHICRQNFLESTQHELCCIMSSSNTTID